ncbi:MAG: low molecular weight phosphatase family protein [Phycisphaerae bacterium]|nr:low molecular weight phosphatase family protein [Phycisphaerae bacterium]
MPPIRLLFLCTGNSARSLMAEALAPHLFPGLLAASSAGSKPTGSPNPLALATLQSHNIPHEHLSSKGLDVVKDQPWDLIITLCGSAHEEVCPVLPIDVPRAHWGFPDPPAAKDPEACFERVCGGIEQCLRIFMAQADQPIPDRAAAAAAVAERFCLAENWA